MDRIEKYQNILITYLREYGKSFTGAPAQVENQVIIDREQHHYLFFRVGWQGKKYIHLCLFHFEIKNNKIWIHQNETEALVGDELIEKGIAKEDIVLGFQPEHIRPHTGFATT